MDCIYLSCRNPANEDITCDKCSIPKYCSENCLLLDKERHVPTCIPHLYSLRDFTAVKDSQKHLGTGAYGEVQLVQRKGTRELYAQKIYKKSLLSSLIPLKVLFREISVHKTLIHPNIVRLFDHMEDYTKLYLIMEYVEKGSLFDLLKKKGRLSEKEAWSIFTQTCVGLSYLHIKNVLHRDLKPENLLIGKDDVIKICDFGWSAQSTEQRQTFCGTLDYMSPEVLNKQIQSFKVDIWALGILLYEMLHAAPPFRGRNPRELSRMISERNYVVSSHVSNEARVLINELLLEDPAARPGISQILSSDWVKKFTENKLRVGLEVLDPENGTGVVQTINGLVVEVNFSGKIVEMIENDVLRISPVSNQEEEVKAKSKSEKILKGVKKPSLPSSSASNTKLQPKPEQKRQKSDFENIKIEPLPVTEKKLPVNKSRFLQRFKKDT